jgi:uncharacterized protein
LRSEAGVAISCDISKRAVTGRRRFLIFAALGCAVPCAVFAGSYDDYFKAVALDDAETVRDLLARGFDPNTTEAHRGDTGLVLALREDSMRVFKVLIDAPDIDLEATIHNGDNALMIAAWKGNKTAVEALIAKDVEVNRPGWAPLHYAAANGAKDIVALLLDKSAYIDAESPNKTTPLMMAAAGGHMETVRLLLDEGADARLKNMLGMTAADFALKSGNTKIAETLAEHIRTFGK